MRSFNALRTYEQTIKKCRKKDGTLKQPTNKPRDPNTATLQTCRTELTAQEGALWNPQAMKCYYPEMFTYW